MRTIGIINKTASKLSIIKSIFTFISMGQILIEKTMIATLFSFQGRITRLPYFLWSLALSIIFPAMIGTILAGSVTKELMNSAIPQGYYVSVAWLMQLGTSTLITLIPVVLFYAWMSLVLICKRTRDMNQSMKFAYVYVGVFLTIFISSVGTVSSIIIMGMNLILLFKPTLEFNPNFSNSEIFGDRDDAGQELDWSDGENTLAGTDADIVARAAQLREQQVTPKAAEPESPITQSVPRATKSFGRRSLQGT